MATPVTLKTQKALLTRYTNNLKRLLSNCDAITAQVQTEHPSSGMTAAERRDTELLQEQLQQATNQVLSALNTLTTTVDANMPNLQEEEKTQLNDYLEMVQDTVERATIQRIWINAHLKLLPTMPESIDTSVLETSYGTPQPARVKLPAIPIPTFSGSVLDFQNFWALFSANVHNQPLTKLQKFNYLMNALQGDAKELLKRYVVTDANYDHAVELLHAKYGNKARLIDTLQMQLEDAKANSTDIAAQRRLLETLFPIVTQLQQEHIHLDGSYSAKKVLAKFSQPIQREILKRHLSQDPDENDWSMRQILDELDRLIATEERAQEMVAPQPQTLRRSREGGDRPGSTRTPVKQRDTPSACIFCKSTQHAPVSCPQVSTIVERRTVMTQDNRCFNCARTGHTVRQCTSRGCQLCQGAQHHHTICPQRTKPQSQTVNTSNDNQGNNQSRQGMRTMTPSSQQNEAIPRAELDARSTPKQKGKPRTTHVNPVQTESATETGRRQKAKKETLFNHAATMDMEIQRSGLPATQDTEILHSSGEMVTDSVLLYDQEYAGIQNMQSRDTQNNRSKINDKVLLLTGCARVWNSTTKCWTNVEILFDTGADQSFISETLAQHLGLNLSSPRKLTMRTFGNKTPVQRTVQATTVTLWDLYGQQHQVKLLTTPTLTDPGKTVQLTTDDYAFIRSHEIVLSKPSHQEESCPQILLGCDQLWDFLDNERTRYTLPSVLTLIPSKTGYLLTGRQFDTHERNIEGEEANRPRQRSETPGASKSLRLRMDDTMTDITTNTVATYQEFVEELDRWDKYWTMDSAGVCEFSGTKDEEKKATNEKVAHFFNTTIEKREDGYYVRLPYKDDHAPLPSNKAIALKRLKSVLQMLKSRPDIQTQYQQTLDNQLSMGIVEIIPNDSPPEGHTLHYIPHQAVITPHKETTTLRIVFDASSHFKDAPSLNDVLHQGPTILPEIFAVLLRFRLSPQVAIADVEKAFLQVRLHESDRDATRFFWVRDANRPVDANNLLTLRFTHVTFGLNVSPYLLAGTIQFHLRNYVRDRRLADEISENLYVDNLILSSNTTHDLRQKALKSRRIFADMNMNLREFLSNGLTLQNQLPKDAHAKSTTQKVLGISWDAIGDNITIRCKLPMDKKLTKRHVARRIASVYDPLGWLVPLLTQAKRFQQRLWEYKFTWDEELPLQLQQEWQNITQNANGFQLTFPRLILGHCTIKAIAVFADASNIALAASAYLVSEEAASLAMAKSKLHSVHSKSTIPKLEPNALTLACRLARSVYQAIRSRTSIQMVHIFSDSQIALSWLGLPPHNANAGRLVHNRLKEVRNIVDSLHFEGIAVNFRYIATAENPADAGTRGLTGDQLSGHIWWTGPAFLCQPEDQWSCPSYELRQEYTSDTMRHQATITVLGTETPQASEKYKEKPNEAETPLIDLTRFSNFLKAKRVVATVFIAIRKFMKALPLTRISTMVTKAKWLHDSPDNCSVAKSQIIRKARIHIIQDHQAKYLTQTYRKSVKNTVRLFQDTEGIWRSKGRLEQSSLPSEAQTPIFIAPNSELAALIIQDAHGPYHQGVDHTMATVRAQYWIPRLRQQVRKHIQRCVPCRRLNALPYAYPDASDLPQRRVQRCRTFQHIGLDFFDLPTESDTSRTYGCIFTCTTTRLIHLEMVDSMGTEDFINALRRFIARRGKPDTITCDNAPTFLLASRILANGVAGQELNTEVEDMITSREIVWKHITPYAPWQGAFYERLIKSIKHALYKALRGTYHRTRDHLRTILTEIEASLNTRPLTYQAEAHKEWSSVRPIDFVQKDIDLSLHLPTTLVDDLDYHPSSELRALQTQQQVVDALQSSVKATERFWTIWKEQYLTNLRETHWRAPSQKLGTLTPTIGDIVLISDPILPKNDWLMAKITSLRTGRDGQIRDAELITGTKRKIRRPVNLLIPLEIQRGHNEEKTHGSVDNRPTMADPQREETPTHGYNLRPRLQSRMNTTTTETQMSTTIKKRLARHWFLFYITTSNQESTTQTSPVSGQDTNEERNRRTEAQHLTRSEI